MKKKFFEYGEKEISFLSRRDERLGKFIEKKGFVKRYVFEDFFEGLCYNIINQQLSMKAADTLYQKITERFGEIAPEKLRNSEELAECGISRTKAQCIAECADRFSKGEFSYEKFLAMNDGEIIKTLSDIHGIGAWTAEMTLIFCLARTNVLSLSDFGIRRGLSVLHKIDIKNVKEMQKFKELYSPFGTTASIYLWEVKDC